MLLTTPENLIINELSNLFHDKDLASRSLYGLIGDPVDKSLSYISHNASIRQLGLSSVYFKCQVSPDQLAGFLVLAKKTGIKGLSVTMPLKEEIIPYLDYIDPWAKKVGAVNTLLFEEGIIKGFNTDGNGALDAIEVKMKVAKKRMIIIGAGGTCKALATAAMERGAQVMILNRSEKKAIFLAEQLSCEGGGLDRMASECQKGYDILVNATPSETPIQADFFLPKTLVMDVKTVPKETAFLQIAQKKGCTLVYGYELFINQAVSQFKLWFDKEINIQKTKEILEKEVLHIINAEKQTYNHSAKTSIYYTPSA